MRRIYSLSNRVSIESDRGDRRGGGRRRTFSPKVIVTFFHDPESGVIFKFVFPFIYQSEGSIADSIVGGLE